MAISIDYKRGLPLPRLKVTPHHIYFINKPTCQVFAVVEEGNTPTESTLFMYGSDLGKQNSPHVVVCLEKYIKENKTQQQKKLIIRPDNCYAQNKNQYMIAFCADLIRRDIFDDVRLDFLPVGHTKFNCDRVFGILSNSMRYHDVHNSQEVVHVSNGIRNLKGVLLKRKDFEDRATYFETNFQSSISKISQKLHFRIFKSKTSSKKDVIRCLSSSSCTKDLIEKPHHRGKIVLIVFPKSGRSCNVLHSGIHHSLSHMTPTQLPQE